MPLYYVIVRVSLHLPPDSHRVYPGGAQLAGQGDQSSHYIALHTHINAFRPGTFAIVQSAEIVEA